MRKTLTLDEDVAALLAKVQAARGGTLKETVNEALRLGLTQMREALERRGAYRTPSTSLGRCLVGSIDNVAEVLAIGEGEDFR